MRAVIQRVSKASVLTDEKVIANISKGVLILLGIEVGDTEKDVQWLAKKISALRIFPDNENQMNKSLIDINGQVIVVSQFTLHAKIKKGNRPSFIKSANAQIALPLYEKFKAQLSLALEKPVQSGCFGSNMQISLVNEGPFTIFIDTKDKC